jgi:hypothetical protein
MRDLAFGAVKVWFVTGVIKISAALDGDTVSCFR